MESWSRSCEVEKRTSWIERAEHLRAAIAIQQDALIDLLGAEPARRLPVSDVLRQASQLLLEAMRDGVPKPKQKDIA